MTPHTLEQIRAALPTHIMLTPGKSVIKIGDQVYSEDKITQMWSAPRSHLIGAIVPDGPLKPWRRPIPPHILDNQAFHLLLDGGVQICDHFADKAENLGIIKKLGGLDNYREQLKAGRLYDKWLLEQMEGV